MAIGETEAPSWDITFQGSPNKLLPGQRVEAQRLDIESRVGICLISHMSSIHYEVDEANHEVKI